MYFLKSRESIPTQEDIQSAPLKLVEMEAKMARTDARIELLCAQLQLEHIRRESLAGSIALERSIHVPIRRVPPEILGAIFEYCVEPMDNEANEWRSESMICPAKSPLLLMRVCWRWRCVALDTPSIWRVVDIRLETLRMVNLIMVVPFWLAHNHPLDVFIGWGQDRPRDHEETYDGTLKLLRAALCRIRKLTLDSPDSDSPGLRQWRPHRMPTPLLESYQIRNYRRPFGVVIDAPNLQTLGVQSNASLYTTELLHMLPSLRSMSSVTFNSSSITGFEFLHLVSQLRRVSYLSCSISSLQNPAHAELLSIKRLTSLSISWETSKFPVLPWLTRHFALPSLKSLSLSNSETEPFEDISLLTNDSFATTLVSLNLRRFDLKNSGEFLRKFVALERLELNICGSTLASLLALETCCPRLHELALISTPGDDTQGLSRLIETRGVDCGPDLIDEVRVPLIYLRLFTHSLY